MPEPGHFDDLRPADVAELPARLRAWLEQGAMFHHGPRRMFYRLAGAGEPLLLLHGYPTASWGFHEMWPDLTARFRVIAPDLPGSGFSDKPPDADYTVAALADTVQALLQSVGMNRVHVLAHAYGCTTAQELLARQVGGESGDPRVELQSVCFVNGGLFHEGTRPTPTQKLLLSPIGPFIARTMPQPYRMFDRKLRRCFGPDTQPTAEEMRELWHVLRWNLGHRIVPHMLRYLQERVTRRERWVGAMVHADCPLGLINGDADPISGRHVPAIWKQILPDAPFLPLPGAIGHYPPLEAPHATRDAYQQFRDTIPRRE